MDFHVVQQGITIDETVLNEMLEQAVDCEIVLPDFCPDISRLLKCRSCAKILSKTISAGKLTIEGAVIITVLYVDSDTAGVRSHDVTVNFTRELDVGADADNGIARVTTHVDYMNCRAVTARKLEAHGAITMHVTVCVKRQTQLITGAEGYDVQLHQDDTDVTSLAGCAEKYLSVNEEVEVEQGGNAIRSILRSDACVISPECKTVTNKAIVKGNLLIRALYCTEVPMQVDKLEITIPFSQILDIEGADENCQCQMEFDITSLELRPRTGMDGECKALSISARICIMVRAYRDMNVPVLLDAYSTQYELTCSRTAAPLEKRIASMNETYVCKKSIDLPQDIQSVMDLWCDTSVDSVKCDDKTVSITGVVTICILSADSDGVAVYSEKGVDYQYKYDMDTAPHSMRCTPQVKAASASYTLTGPATTEVRVELTIMGDVFSVLQIPIIAQLDVDESRPKTQGERAALIVYYAGAGEKVWDIARRYNTTVAAIQSANDVDTPVLTTNTMLLIPSA